MGDFFRRNHFLMRRLHSLTGIAPVGGFLLFHLYENFKATQGAAAYNESIVKINSLPMVWALEVFLIILPLYFHALYGVYIAMEARYGNVTEYPYERNWAFWLQRVTGLITLAYVTQHLYHFRFQKMLGAYAATGNLPTFDVVQQGLASNAMFIWYIIGIVAAAYHLCNGVYTFLITWGITIGPKSQRITAVVTNSAFVLVSALGLAALWAFR